MPTRDAARHVGQAPAKILGVQDDGTFEAIVSVFGNVDLAGDRVLPGAFVGSLSRWEASGDPIPVIFSHRWDDLDAHLGDVVEAREVYPGDELLDDPRVSDEVKAAGGLYVKGKLDIDEPHVARVHRMLQKRRIKEFSFAYDVVQERRSADGANDLVELDVIEVGPTLKGMNPATSLLDVKSSTAAGAAVTQLRADGHDELAELLGKALPPHAFVPNEDGKCSLCGRGKTANAHINALSAPASGQKAQVTLAGAVEGVLQDYAAAASSWAAAANLGAGGFYAAWLEASYPDESRAVVLVEGWDDPPMSGTYYELRFATGDDGAVTVADAQEVDVLGVVVPKSRHARTERKVRSDGSADVIVPGDTVKSDDLQTDKANAQRGGAEDPAADVDRGLSPSVALAQLDLASLT